MMPTNTTAQTESVDTAPAGLHITVHGQVQGVGFRPFIYRLARHCQLTGFVQNAPEGVILEVHGGGQGLQAFVDGLRSSHPPAACITELWIEDIPFDSEATDFQILQSKQGPEHIVLISPDISLCQSCRKDMDDPANRRLLYPFTNCTDCGPRYTITAQVPYDRSTTSMACFPMCPECQREYDNPLDRRFHAQPNACPACGPQLWSTDSEGKPAARGEQAIRHLAAELSKGRIAAVKGLGGFHLACNALDPEAVEALRRRKSRPAKPLAVMVPDLETARTIAVVSPSEAEWLLGQASPITLVPQRPDSPLPRNAAPDTDRIGLLLPYTPLHRCLLHFYAQELSEGEPPVLIMTSGNASQEPIALGNREALRRLGDIADCFLLHDRDILVRCDDSVLAVLPDVETPLLFRRARGLTPKPIRLTGSGPNVLGLGAEAKSTFCLTKGNLAFVSQHIGDLDNREAFDFFLETLEHLKAVLGVEPTALIRDLHPDYLSSQLAQESQGLPVFTLQHHFAHIRAVLAENAHEDPAIGVALDGTGLGDDGTLWGGELLYVAPRTNEHHRLGHFQQIALPGGEAAIAEPWRTAQSHLYALGEAMSGNEGWPWLAEHSKASRLVNQMLEKGVNCPLSSSCGRLFDAVSALLGLSLSISYEGQAAIRLESMQDPAETAGYPCPHRFSSGLSILETGQLFAAVHEAWRRKTAPGVISRRFHLGLCRGVAEWASRAAGDLGVRDVALSGGVLQNMTIASRLPEELRRMGLRPLVHASLPPNDACISLGQAAYARTALSMARPPESPED